MATSLTTILLHEATFSCENRLLGVKNTKDEFCFRGDIIKILLFPSEMERARERQGQQVYVWKSSFDENKEENSSGDTRKKKY